MREIGITGLVVLLAFASYVLFMRDTTSILHNAALRVTEVLVIRAMDGDTFEVVKAENPDEIIRIQPYLMDAPDQGECFYQESRDFATNALFGKRVWLVHMAGSRDQPTLSFIYLDERLTHLWQDDALNNGYAKTALRFREEERYEAHVKALERNAQLRGDGLWGVCSGA